MSKSDSGGQSCPQCGKEYKNAALYDKHMLSCLAGADEIEVATPVETESTPAPVERTAEEKLLYARTFAKNAFRVEELSKYLVIYCSHGHHASVLEEITNTQKVELAAQTLMRNNNWLFVFKRK